jgi:hypothetical protein
LKIIRKKQIYLFNCNGLNVTRVAKSCADGMQKVGGAFACFSVKSLTGRVMALGGNQQLSIYSKANMSMRMICSCINI